MPHLADRLDLDLGLQHASLEFDTPESVAVDHMPHLANQIPRCQRLSVLVLPRVVAHTTAAGVFVERVGGKAHPVPDTTAQQIAHRLTGRLADEVEARRLDGRVGPGRGIQRVLARHQHGLRAIGPRAPAFDKIDQSTGQPIWIRADDPGSLLFQGPGRSVTAVGLGDADDTAITLELEDRPQGVWRVQPVRASERRVRDGDGVDAHVGDLHALLPWTAPGLGQMLAARCSMAAGIPRTNGRWSFPVSSIEDRVSRMRIEDRGSMYQTNGSSFAAIITTAIPAKPINVSSMEKVFRVSASVRPLILPTTQNPLSFIHGIGFEPQPIASAR